MFAWFLTPIGRKVGLYGALAIALFFAYRHATSRAWNQGFDKGKQAGVKELTEAKEKEWRAKEDALFEAAKLVADGKLANDTEKTNLAQLRGGIKSDLATGLERLRTDLRQETNSVSAVPADEIDTRIRIVLNELRSANEAN